MTTPSSPPILTVSQITNAIKHCLEKTFPLIWLQGEVSNFKPHPSGHLYFSLKDANAQISAVMFRPDAINLKVHPKDGAQVVVRGEINVYPAGGRYQILVKELRPVGLGELLLKLEELKIKLHKKGWFRPERKKPLPKFPKTIGVVTSPSGAAIQDMLNILSRRFSGFHLILNPVKVQGEGAAQEIAQAIEQFNRHNLVDVMIIGRGGGSIEDLWAFNEEIVAEAIFNSHIPIICAVGHETDHCIADHVADVRAPTPSAAAEIVIAEKAQQLHHLTQMQKRMQHTVWQLIRQDRHRLQGIQRHPFFQTPFALLGPWIQRLDSLRQENSDLMKQQLATKKLLLVGKQQLLQSLKPSAKLAHYRQKIKDWSREIGQTMMRMIQQKQVVLQHADMTLNQRWQMKAASYTSRFQTEQKRRQLDLLWQRHQKQKLESLAQIKNSLDTINPKNLLTKGYCILFSKKRNSAITSIQHVKKEEQVQILLSDGSLAATVDEIIPQSP